MTVGGAYEAGELSVLDARSRCGAQVKGRGAVHRPGCGLHRRIMVCSAILMTCRGVVSATHRTCPVRGRSGPPGPVRFTSAHVGGRRRGGRSALARRLPSAAAPAKVVGWQEGHAGHPLDICRIHDRCVPGGKWPVTPNVALPVIGRKLAAEGLHRSSVREDVGPWRQEDLGQP
jgi:hypothetical protein